jgi:hypothetical protein
MGGTETATGATGPTGEAQETEVVGGGFEGHKGSHQKALGGLPQSQESGGVGPTPGPHHGSAPYRNVVGCFFTLPAYVEQNVTVGSARTGWVGPHFPAGRG